MFQQGSKLYLNASNWKRYQHLNYGNNNTDSYRDNDNPTQKAKKFPCYLKNLNRIKTGNKSSHKSGLRKASSIYSVNSVKERFKNEAGSNTGIDIYKLKQKMANTLSVMTNVLRNVVSKQRIRYKEKGFNLDLAYVCDNIIAMGYPADNYESMYRNPLGDVYKFLEDNHHDHYKIYNLCLERSYDITKFHGRVSVYPFEDHNPPTIELILKFCEDVDNWLKADALNVAAVHCKAGKGRTGTMICCYLLYSGQQRTAEDALACYDEKRTKDRKGVTIPSQRRYVQYFSKLMRSALPYERRTLQFCEIRFSKANTLHSQGTVHCSISVLQEKVQQLQNFPIDFRKNSILDIKNPSLPVSGDIKVELTKNTKKIFHFWFNTFFVSDSSVVEGEGSDVKFVYTLQKWEIDDVHKDKCYPDDFKVELVFYIDDNNLDRDLTKIASSNRPTSNHRTSMQNTATARLSSLHQQHQHQQQQSNNYSLSQNNSSASEINFICDQKSSSSTSVCSSLGVSGTDTSNGYESNRGSTQRNSGVVQNLNNHHSNHYNMAVPDVNDSVVRVFSTTSPAQHVTLPPSYMEQYQQQQQHHHQPHKQNQKPSQKNTATQASNTNHGHFQRHVAGGVDIIGEGGEDLHAYQSDDMAATCQPSTNLSNVKRTKCSISSSNNCNNSYNHNHSNSSSKTSSVSSQSSSSANGDNEEDWESGESQAKQLENITLLLSTSSLTNQTSKLIPPPAPVLAPAPSQHSTLPNTTSTVYPNSLKNLKNLSSDISNFSNTPSPSSNSTSISPSLNYPPNTASKISNSRCSNRVVDVDDVDDDEKNDDENKLKSRKFNSKQVVKPAPYTADTNTKSVEFKDEDNNITSSIMHETMPTPSSNRPKLMHLLMAPKTVQPRKKSPHKPIFKRKASNKIVKVANANSSICAANKCPDTSCNPSAGLAVATGGGGVATTSKLKLRIKLKKNKFKLSQKFKWFQSYFRSDPVDFCENFVQQTTSMRHNSVCSMASRSHKLSTSTAPPSSPPPPVATTGFSREKLDRATSVQSVSTSNASIATGDMCEDYYSSICDNQLSFSNSPCKSPRTMADLSSSISAGHGSSFGSSFVKSTASSNSYLRERRETMPGSRRSNGNVVIVAAKPAKTHAIGFNVKVTNLASQDSFEINEDNEDLEASPASIYYTPSSTSAPVEGDTNENTNTAFVFPQATQVAQNVSTECNQSVGLAAAKPQTKYSLNLVIVKEFPEPPQFTNESDGIDSDYCESQSKRLLADDVNSAATLSEDLDLDATVRTGAAATDSVCSNSSSSGFCTSECCTTNSSSSSCNCNPFVMDLEKHVACTKPEQQQNTESVVDGNAECKESVNDHRPPTI